MLDTITALNQKLLEYKVKEIEQGLDMAILFEENLEGNGPRELVNLLLARDIRIGVVFAGNDAEGYRYVIGSREVDVRLFASMLREKFEARGGGKPEMVQGSVNGLEAEIREAIETCGNELR